MVTPRYSNILRLYSILPVGYPEKAIVVLRDNGKLIVDSFSLYLSYALATYFLTYEITTDCLHNVSA